MALNINVKFNIDEELKKTVKSINDSTKTIEVGMKKLADSVEKGMKGATSGIDSMITNINKLGQGNAIKSIVQQYDALNLAQKNNTISASEYSKQISNLFIELQKVAGGLDNVKNKQKGVGGLSDFGVQTAKSGGFANQGVLDKIDVPNLQQIIMLSKEELKSANLTQEARRRIADQLQLATARMKTLNMSSSQLAALEAKNLAVSKRKEESEANITRQKQKQAEAEAIAARRSNFGTAFSFAKTMQEGTIPQTAAKIKEMQIAREALVKTDANYKQNLAQVNVEINRLTKEQNAATKSGLQLAGQTDKTSKSLRQMGQMVGAYFSVYAVKNFVTELANVTGEFDLQRKSLGALLQNKEQADAIFEKIKESSLKSPFSVMDLTNYTKQLAAYRIEGDKLFDTMTMLADVSSGLGVDMGRIILAFGQVKAASVLRGQELRQFTEAGIPLVQLLADKFGELEDRTVSTGEVFDKISNRLVPFQMIEGIFKDMTKSGGMFYEMQKIQAETIKGRIVNLTDAYQLMLDKIGTSNTGVIKGFISLLESMLRNFDGILTVIVPLISAFAAYKVGLLVTNIAMRAGTVLTNLNTAAKIANLLITKQLTKAEVAATAAANGLNSALLIRLASNPYALIAAALVGVGVAIWKVSAAANELNRELGEIEKEGIKNYNNLYNTFNKLLGTMKDTTKTVSEQNDAYEELKRTFKDILPEKFLNIQYLKSEALAYSQVKDAIYAKIKAQTSEKKLLKLEESMGDDIADAAEESSKNIAKRENISTEQALAYVQRIKEYIDTTNANYNQAYKKAQEMLGNNAFLMSDYIKEYTKYNRKFREITENTFSSIDNSSVDYGVFANTYKKVIDHLPEIVTYYEKTWNKISADFDYKQRQQIKNRQQAWLQQNIDTFTKGGSAIELKMAEQLKVELSKILGTDDQKAIEVKLQSLAEKFKVSFDRIALYLKADDKGFNEWGESINQIIDSRIKNIERYNAAANKNDPNIKGLIDNQTIAAYTSETNMLKELQKYYRLKEDKSSSSGESKLIKALKEEIKLIETLQKEYDKLVKAGSGAAEARQKVTTEYDKNIKEIQKSLSEVGINVDFRTLITSDKNVLLDLYKKQMEQFKGNAEVQKLLTESFGKLGVEIQILNLNEIELQLKNEFERIKNNRSISLELNDAPESTRDILKLLYGISEKDILSEMTVFQQRLNDYIRGGILKIGAGGGVIKDFTKLTKDEFLKILEPFKDGDQYNQIAKTLIDAFDYLKGEQIKYIDNIGKSYKELLNKYADFNVRIIEVENKKNQELKALEENFKNSTIKDLETYNALKLAIENRSAKEIAEIKYQELKESEEYINMFDRIGMMSEDNMVASYIKVRKGITDAFSEGAISLREFQSSLVQLDKQFQAFYTNTSLFGAYFEGGVDGIITKLQQTGSEIQSIASDIEKMKDTNDPEAFKKMLGSDKIEFLKKQGVDIMKIFTQSGGKMGAIAGKVSEIGTKMSGIAGKAAGVIGTIAKVFSIVDRSIRGLNEVLDSINSLKESLNSNGEKTTTDFEKFRTALGSFNDETMSWFNKAMKGDAIGALAGIISSWINVFTNFNKLGDQQIQENIDETTRAITRQQRALDKLSDTLDEYLGNDWIKQQKLIADGYLQLAANIQKNIDAEKSKKNPDEDVLEQYEEDLYDAEKAAKDTVKAMVEEMTGADIKSAAEDFANIWIESFLAGEDAMKNMEERFGEMIKNMIMKTIVSKVIEARLRKFYEQLEADIKSDDELTLPEILNLSQIGLDAIRAAGKDLEGFEAFFQQISNMLGLGSTSDMDTLQKGISNITEESAQIIAAYLNSLKYEVFKQTGFLSQMSVNSALTMNMTSDILQQSRLTYQVIMAIKSWTDSISTTSPNAGLGIRVYGI